MFTKKLKVHFIGIGGIGVSALARYYLEKGHEVSGSDLVSSEITDALKKSGAKIFIGPHAAKNLPMDVNLVIYSPAIPSDNPELLEAKKLKSKIQNLKSKIKIQSYPEALGELTKKYFTIAVCGSHGKSTVASIIGILLTKAGFDPTIIVGTKVKEFGDSNFRMGGYPKSNYPLLTTNYQLLIIEADEHFASFLNYWPKIIVLTNIDKDHLDFYKNFKNILKAFKKFISHLPKDGILILNKDDQNIKKNLKNLLSPKNTAFSTIVENRVYYSLRQKEAKKLKKILKVPGDFNISNALAALAVARALKIPDKISFKALSEYRGSWRRFEVQKLRVTGYSLPVTVISDYAHHPTQIKATLKAAREKFPNKKIWVVFQPHQYQRTYYLFDDFVKVFAEALKKTEDGPLVDKLVIADIFDVAGREEKTIKKKISSEKLVSSIKYKVSSKRRKEIIYTPNIEEVADYLRKNLRDGLPAEASAKAAEVVIVMGAGDIYRLVDLLIDKRQK